MARPLVAYLGSHGVGGNLMITSPEGSVPASMCVQAEDP